MQAQDKSFPWLVDEHQRTRALIKYDIKMLDTRLDHLMLFKWIGASHFDEDTLKPAEEIIFCCTELMKRYEQLTQLMPASIDHTGDMIDDNHATDPTSCYKRIQDIKQQNICFASFQEETNLCYALIEYYKKLVVLLTDCSISCISHAQEQPNAVAYEPSPSLLAIINATQVNSWLSALVSYSIEVGENTGLYRLQLAKLSDSYLKMIYQVFESSEYMDVINSIFYFKINPNHLYSEPLHAEKLISVKRRLTVMHAFIELIHETVMLLLRQRGHSIEHDYLFHGQDIPQGIVVEGATQIRTLIASMVKQWRLPRLINIDEDKDLGSFNDIYLAYQYWFNPDRLIDTVRSLKQEIGDQFEQILSARYKQLSTMRCVELYGYFSNKSTNYLMRTLLALSRGEKVLLIEVLTDAQQQLIKETYDTLAILMKILRAELKERHISTADYLQTQGTELKPGKRIVQAIHRLLYLYTEDEAQTFYNPLLEKLFKDLEGSSFN